MSLARTEGSKLGSTSGTRVISTTSRRELSSSSFFLQGRAPKEIRAILTETLACFLPGRAKDLSALLVALIIKPSATKTNVGTVGMSYFLNIDVDGNC